MSGGRGLALDYLDTERTLTAYARACLACCNGCMAIELQSCSVSTFTLKKLRDRESDVKLSLCIVLSPLSFNSQGNAYSTAPC